MHGKPILPGCYPDPSICRAGEDYFLVNSSFEYFPGVPLFHSRDLKTWKQIGHVLDRPSQLNLTDAWISNGIFAPTIRYIDKRFYMITTLYGRIQPKGNFLVSTADPFRSWSDPVWIPEMEGIDPDLFQDADGTTYVHWSWRTPEADNLKIRIGQAAIDLESGRLLESPREIWSGSGGHGPEAPHLYRIGDWYYLCIAEGGTEYGHMQTIARSGNLKGPYKGCPRNPILTHRSLDSDVHAVGHADLTQAPDGEWVGVVHGIRPKGYHRFHVLGRETYAFPVRWEEDGWPVFGDKGKLPEVHGPPDPQATAFADSFAATGFPHDWNWLRMPHKQNYQRRGDGRLELHGADDSISSTGRPTWIGVRQRAHACRAKAECSVTHGKGTGEAGLCVFQNLRHHACVGLKEKDGKAHLFTRLRVGTFVVEKWGPLWDENAVSLEIKAGPLEYTLGYRTRSSEFIPLETMEARFLSTEVSGLFTGVYFALYAEAGAVLHCTNFEVLPTP